MPSKNKPSIWQKLSHAPSRSYADAAPAHPSRPGKGPSPYSAPSTLLTPGALAAAEKAHRYQHRQEGSRDSIVSSYVGASSRAASAAAAPSSREQESRRQQESRRAPGPRTQTLQYNEAESRFMMMDDPDEDVTDEASGIGSDAGSSTQWRQPGSRKESARSDVGPHPSAPVKQMRPSRRRVEQDENSPAERIHADRRRGSASDVPPQPTVIEHHHHYYGPPPAALAGGQTGTSFSGPVTTATYVDSPSSPQAESSSYDGPTPRPAPLPATFQSAVVLPTPPSSELGSPASDFPALGQTLGHALNQALLVPTRSTAAAGASWDSDASDDEAAFYTPRSSMTSMNFPDPSSAPAAVEAVSQSIAPVAPQAPAVLPSPSTPASPAATSAVIPSHIAPPAAPPMQDALDDSSDSDAAPADGEDQAPDTPHQESAAPVLVLQPPTPTTFPLHDGSSRSMASPGQAPGQEKNLFSEVSFHPDQVAARRQQTAPAPAPLHVDTTPMPVVDENRSESPAPAGYEYEYDYEEPQPPRPAFAARERNSSPSPPSSSPRASMLYADDDDAYSGVLLYALQEEDEGPLPSPGLPGVEPPRQSRSAPNLSPATTPPASTYLPNTSASSPLSGPPSLSGLRPASAQGHRAESVRSNVSSSSRYSQTSYASYANERDVPRPLIIPGPPSTALGAPLYANPSNVSSPLSSPMHATPSSSSYSRNQSASPSRSSSYLKSPTYPSAGSHALDSPPTAPSSLFSPASSQARYNTPFLPRPTSALMHSYDMAGSYPSAPASVVSDSGHRPRKAQSSVGDDRPAARERGGIRPASVMMASPSEVGTFQRKRLMSEGASLRDVRTPPQLMGDVARGQGGTSMSGGSGYSSLTLPSAVYRPAKSPARYTGKLSYDTMGMPDTTMATIMVSSTAHRPKTPSIAPSSGMSSLLRRNSTSATPAHLLPTPLISVAYTAHTPPPKKLSSTGVLVRIWAVAVDGYDALAARDAAPGFVPGRSFVGKVIEWGDACAGMFTKGEFVFGLRDLKRSGALSEFIVIERRYLAKAPPVSSSGLDGDDGGLTLEDIAALPLLGVTAHRAVGGIPRGSRALVLLSAEPPLTPAGAAESAGPSDWAVGVLACQELLARGVIVVLQVTTDQGEVWARQHMPTLREGHVRIGDAVAVVHSEHEGSFDLVLDCVGGRRLYDASRRILSTGGQFTTLKGDAAPTGEHAIPSSGSAQNYRSLRRAFVKKDRKHVDYRVISPSGSGPIVDFMGEDVRDILEWIGRSAVYRPVRIAKVLPFERAAEAFAVRPRSIGGAKANSGLQGSYECEEQVWGIRLVS